MSKCLPKAANTLDAWLDDAFLDDFEDGLGIDLTPEAFKDDAEMITTSTITTTPSDVCEGEKISLKDLILDINSLSGVGGRGKDEGKRYIRLCISIDPYVLMHIDTYRQKYGLDRSKLMAYAAMEVIKKLEDAS